MLVLLLIIGPEVLFIVEFPLDHTTETWTDCFGDILLKIVDYEDIFRDHLVNYFSFLGVLIGFEQYFRALVILA